MFPRTVSAWWHFLCFFFAFYLRVSEILPTCSLYPPTKACLLWATPAGMDLHIFLHARRHFPSAVPWISEDRLLSHSLGRNVTWTSLQALKDDRKCRGKEIMVSGTTNFTHPPIFFLSFLSFISATEGTTVPEHLCFMRPTAPTCCRRKLCQKY